ncbi:MAG: dATP/dGTP diphosphohydrolase domain-containing protein [Pirellulales bacterium]
MMTEHDVERVVYGTGAVRSADAEDTRYDLISPIGLRRLAQTCAEGAAKYGDRNWERGFPATSLVNHALRHVNSWLAGESDEDHLAHAVWNLTALMHFEELRPDLIDIPSRQTGGAM